MKPYQRALVGGPKQLDHGPWEAILSLLFREEDDRLAGMVFPQTMAKGGDISILLVRSGATEWDDAVRLQGATDLPLSHAGRQRLVHEVGQFAGGVGRGIDLMSVLHGPDEASRETATLLSRAAGGRRREVADLQAVNLGLWEGLLEAEVQDRHPTAFRQWMEEPESVTPPEGERFDDAMTRLTSAVSRGVARAGKRTVAVVLRPMAHAMVRAWLLRLPTTDLWQSRENSSSITLLSVPRGVLAPSRGGVRAIT